MLGPLTRILLHYLTLLRFLVTTIQYPLHSRLGHSMRRNLHNELGSDKMKGVRVSLLTCTRGGLSRHHKGRNMVMFRG